MDEDCLEDFFKAFRNGFALLTSLRLVPMKNIWTTSV